MRKESIGSPPKSGIGSEYGFGRASGFRAFRMQPRSDALHNSMLACSGRSALAAAARYSQLRCRTPKQRVLLPSYLCHTVIQPFVELGFTPAFYPIGSGLSVDPDDVARCVDDGTVAVVILEYFGFTQDPTLLQSLRRRFPEVILINDRTHALLTDLGNAAVIPTDAIIVYSARKWAPFPDLGIVCWPPHLQMPDERLILDSGYDLRFALTRFAGLMLRSAFQALPCEALRRWSVRVVHYGDDILDRRCLVRQASPASRLLLSIWDWRQSWDIRRRNFKYLLDNWPHRAGSPLYAALDDKTCPLGFPVRNRNRLSLRQLLIENRVYPPIHWILPAGVDGNRFVDSARLAAEEITIPVDQRYSYTDMQHITRAAAKAA